MTKMFWLDKKGFPVEHIAGRKFLNWLRDLIHGRCLACPCCYQRRMERISAFASNARPMSEIGEMNHGN